MQPRVAFVTGASSGIGEAIARRYAAAGVKVVAAARRGDRLDALVVEFGETSVLPIVLDVRDDNAVEQAVRSLPPAFAEVDVLVNNAGLALGLEPAQDAVLDNWERMIETNCTGLVYVTRAAAARDGRPPARPRRQHGLDRRHVSVPGRERVRRDQVVRAPVQPRPAR